MERIDSVVQFLLQLVRDGGAPIASVGPPPVPAEAARGRGQLREKLGAVPEAFCCGLDGRLGMDGLGSADAMDLGSVGTCENTLTERFCRVTHSQGCWWIQCEPPTEDTTSAQCCNERWQKDIVESPRGRWLMPGGGKILVNQ